MRVVHVTPLLRWPSGVAEYVAGLSTGLADLGVDVEILAAGQAPAPGEPDHPLLTGVPVRWFPVRKVFGRYRYPQGIASALREAARRADIVHTHQAYSPGTWVGATTRARLVASLYLHPEHVEPPGRMRHRRELDLLLRRVDLIVAVSEAERRLISSIRTPKRSRVVWPGLLERPAPSGRPPVGRPLALTVARLSATKHIDVVLRAAAATRDIVDWVVVGDGSERPSLERLCRELGLDPAAVLPGTVSDQDLDALYQRATVLVSASTEESFGIAVLKGIAHGCRPVLTGIAPHREIVDTVGLETDWLMPVPVAADLLAETTIRACRSGRPARSAAAKVPTWTDSAQRLLAAYADLVG